MYTLPLHAATSVVANNALPNFDKVMSGALEQNPVISNNGLTMDITQTTHNAVIKWNSFDVGGSATVNFWGPDNHNTLNYVNSANMSQIYGTINANNNGNIFIVNPAGVQIGNSAQINVGSLYVSNKTFSDDLLKSVNESTVLNDFMQEGSTGDAALMSLGNINAGEVTFEGNGRIVIDSERLLNSDGNSKNTNFEVHTDDAGNVLIGYDAYVDTDKDGDGHIDGYKNQDRAFNQNVFVNGQNPEDNVKGYMWVEDVKQLQAINTNLSGNYALRNSIDATSTANGEGFNPIGLYETGKVVVNNNNEYGFTGNFDGLDYNIFGLTINRESEANVGLFGVAHNANINNVTLVGGSITGGSVVGSVVGAALGTTHITNATNSASVTGNTDVGGIVGYSGNKLGDGTVVDDDKEGAHFTNLVNTGTVHSKGESDGNGGIVSNAGGLIGYMYNGKLDGNSYNLGDVSGKGYNVGGLVGHAENSTIGDGTNLVYNRLDVEGAYNVGGIVGNMEGTTVQNAENSGNVAATGYTDGTYSYHSAHHNEVKDETVNVANVGGIAGSSSSSSTGTVSNIIDAQNTGDVTSSKVNNQEYYAAGNVGGIVGSAVNTNITNATNKENDVRGAHNVGGVAGYFGNSNDNNDIKYTINRGINDGGDIMATGARNESSFVTEIIRPSNDNQKEEFIIGNIGGIAGYMDGDNVYITGSGNRGTVHTDEPADPANVKEWQKAANVGGVVGKIDRSDTKKLDANNNIVDDDGNLAQAAVSDSYNTGDVLGYTGIGGIAGLMYNGEIASSYNLGYLRSTRQSHVGPATGTTEVVDALNMGGIVGDTTEESNAKALLYDVYNKGQIGDEEFNYFGRHVGGVVGRLSGTVEKSYNTGAIYNGYNVVGGIAGWVATGTIQNAFNTGNITVYNKNENTSQLGGIVGAANGGGGVKINNVYNLGTLRSFNVGYGSNAVAGILGAASGNGTVTITNAYTTGNLYSGKVDNSGNFIKDLSEETVIENGFNNTTTKVNSIYAATEWGGSVTNSNTYYIRPDENLVNEGYFTDLYLYNQNNPNVDKDNSNKAIAFGEKSDINQYQYGSGDDHHSLTFTKQNDGDVDGGSSLIASDDNWRIYDGNTPILNAFLPDSEKYFSTGLKDNGGEFIGTIQYGTAYDPLLTIINTNRDLAFNFGSGTNELSISNAAGIAVYGGGLTFNNFASSSGTGYFGGTIYADGALNLNSNSNIGLGSAAQIYGSAVNINTDGKVTIYGDVTATGNIANGAIGNKEYDEKLPNAPTEIEVENKGDISINAGDVDVYGTLTTGKKVSVPGIKDQAVNTWTPGDVDNPYAEMVDIADRFAHKTTNFNVYANIDITANGTTDNSGNVNLYFGNQEEGLITTGGNLTVKATGDVYVDSDLEVGKNMTLTSTGKDGEVLLTLTNIGKVQANKFVDVIESAINGKDINKLTVNDIKEAVDKVYPELHFTEDQAELIIASLKQGSNKTDSINKLKDDISVAYMHDFMHSFEKPQPNTGDVGYKIALNAASGDAKLTVDMWEEDVDNTGKSGFDYTKYDTTFPGTFDEHTFKDELDNLNFIITNTTTNKIITDASKAVYVEVSTGEQLKAIQQAGDSALGYNYALMGDINASDVTDYEAIGGTTGFTGTFDGRGNRIIGLDTTKDDNGTNTNFMANAGIFSTIGEGGTVKNVNIYSGNFTGTTSAGAVAGMNSGRIENVTGFGNTVTITNENGNAGGIVGVNNGNKGNIITNEDGTITLEPAENEQFATGIIDVESIGSVIAKGDNAVAGGLVGTNEGALGNSYSDSAVTSTFVNNQAGLGGVVGVNTEKGNVQYVDSLGVTNGGTTGSSNVGGVIGINKGNMYSGYNESIVSGNDYVGGIIGQNTGKYENDKWNGGTVENVVNATGVTGSSNYVGGLVGTNTGSVTNGRNNGTIAGTNYVGGLVGDNADEHSILTNLVNDSSAEILGVEYVGGIAGKNRGTITADRENNNLINRGSITGHKYVGGVAGLNVGTITNTNIDVELKVNNAVSGDHQYFGGIVGQNGDDKNEGTIENATNSNKIVAPNASYVGGIVGWNTQKGKLIGMGNSNEGEVIGGSYVGGVIGKNDAAIGSKNAAQVGIKNEGVVIATNGGAGGLIGENNAAITNTIMTNKGEVHGNNSNDDSGTGGLIGTNSGAISYSSMTNEVTGTVTGVYNVGGLIGVNKADITGGRDTVNDKDSGYYLNKIYNNGVINVGNYTDADKDGKYEFAASNGQNIGGLFGTNSGKVEAAYNTGAINASGSTNVGGIAGVNEQGGKLDQVFNTVMTGVDDKGNNVYGTITGKDNVGGLVGTNSGTLSNAYNTTGVEGAKGSTGNAVGVNDTNGTIENIYASNTSGNLIGNSQGTINKAYSFSSSDEESTVVEFIDDVDTDKDGIKDRVDKDSYTGFDFTNDWKNYDGSGNPLLKVFLTKVTVDNTKLPNLVYNTQDQDLNIGSLTGDGGAFSAEDDFKAYQNNNSLIQNTDFEHKNAGTYDNWLYSEQIAAGSTDNSFNPNNLGYDIDFEADIDKAQITVDLNQVDRVYGDTAITKGEYGFSYGFNNVLSDKDKAALIEELNKNALNMNTVNTATDDTGLIENGTKTNDAGIHSWTGTVNIADDYKGNYEFVVKHSGTISNNGATITTTGKSVVNQRQLSVSDIVASIVYGNQDGKGFIVSGGKLIGVNSNDGIVYGDNVELNTTLKVEDANIIAGSSYAENKGNRVTADAGKYENSLNFSGLALSGDDANNYVLVNDSFGGTIEVTQATIKVDLNDVDRTYGSTAFNGNGYGISNVQNNANGDIYTTGDFVVNVDTGDDGALTGDNSGRVTNDVGNYTYIGTVTSNKEKLNQNYNIVVNNSKEGNNIGSGVSTVTKADLSITINDVDTTYGTAFDESQYGYTIDKLVNGDGNNNSVMNAVENAINNASGGYHNTGAADGTNGKVTQDAEGDYSLSFKNDITQKDVLTNYNITVVNDGDVNVSKKQIYIGANSEAIQVGGTPDYTGTDINDVLVNGDKLNGDYYYGVENSADEKVVGNHSIGVWIGNTFYDLSETVDWTNVDGFFSNYEVTYNPGTLTVTEQIMPDLPDNWPNNRWDYLFGDNPFDRNENFRERKAEVNFVDGAMEI